MFKKIALTISMGTLLTVLGSSTMMANNIEGPQFSRTSVAPYSAIRFTNVYFRGGETAYVEARGDGSTFIRLQVFDSFGNLVNEITGYGAYVRWTPMYTGSYTIRVENEGGYTNTFILQTN